MHVPLSTKQYKLVTASAGTYCTTGAVLVGWQPTDRRCSWWPTGAAPASLIPVVAIVFHLRFVGCHNKRIFILFIKLLLYDRLKRNVLHVHSAGFLRKSCCKLSRVSVFSLSLPWSDLTEFYPSGHFKVFCRPTQCVKAVIVMTTWLCGCLCVCHVAVLCPNHGVDHHATSRSCSRAILLLSHTEYKPDSSRVSLSARASDGMAKVRNAGNTTCITAAPW